MIRVLWIGSDRPAAQQALARVAGLETLAGLAEGLVFLAASRVDAVALSFPMPDGTPADAIEEVRRLNSRVPVLVWDPQATATDAVRLAHLGAWQVFDAAASPEMAAGEVEAAAEDFRLLDKASGDAGREPWRRFLVGESRAMEDVSCLVRLVGPRRATVLITGETGTGKEMAARAIHMASPRAHLPMVALSCTALPENLLEAELFGHVRGAFTGAVSSRVGRFEQAHGSTLFLDEVGEMPVELQAKLLRVLQEREFQRLGSSETLRVDVRIVAATNRDLSELVRQGRFRDDLYYRLNVVPLPMPPLRDRAADIPLLVRHFVEKVCRSENIPPKRVARDTLERLARYAWPGNVRQLENAVETAVALSGARTSLEVADFRLPPERDAQRMPPRQAPVIAMPDEGLDFERTVSHVERSLLEQALRRAGGNKTAAADMLRLKRTTLAAKLRSLEASWSSAGPPAANMVQ